MTTMDQHWRNLIDAKGGTGLDLSQYPDNDKRDRIQAVTSGYPKVYEDVNGVRFTVEDAIKWAPVGSSSKGIVDRISCRRTWEEVITYGKKGRQGRVSDSMKNLALKYWKSGMSLAQIVKATGIPKSTLRGLLTRVDEDLTKNREYTRWDQETKRRAVERVKNGERLCDVADEIGMPRVSLGTMIRRSKA